MKTKVSTYSGSNPVWRKNSSSATH